MLNRGIRDEPSSESEMSRTAETEPAALRQEFALQPHVTVRVAEGSLALLALQQAVEVVVSAADVAGLLVGVELVIKLPVLDSHHFLSLLDVSEDSSAVGAFARKAGTLVNALKTEGVPAGEFSHIFRILQLQIAQTNTTVSTRKLLPLDLALVRHFGQPPLEWQLPESTMGMDGQGRQVLN